MRQVNRLAARRGRAGAGAVRRRACGVRGCRRVRRDRPGGCSTVPAAAIAFVDLQLRRDPWPMRCASGLIAATADAGFVVDARL